MKPALELDLGDLADPPLEGTDDGVPELEPLLGLLVTDQPDRRVGEVEPGFARPAWARDHNEHGKMPDLVVYLPDREWLVLMEAASSHGPVDTTRQGDLAALFAASTARLVYVSCFPDRAEFPKYVDKIAWESEVWCADHPTHMIHYNGERFLGPYG